MAKISIIVPVYKVEKYLHRCVDSILAQTFKDFELILVDDGSPDGCGEICEEYAQKDTRIRVVHKENGGLSSARNAGLDVAVGEYIGFVDSDDYIAEDMYEVLCRNIIENGADIATCGTYDVYENATYRSYDKDEFFLCDDTELFYYVLKGGKVPATICNKLIKRCFVQEIRFPVGYLYEDVFFHTKLIPQLSLAAITTAPKYYYVHRDSSITTQEYTDRDWHYIEGYKQTLELINREYPTLSHLAEFRYYRAEYIVFGRMLKMKHYKSIPSYSLLRDSLKKDTWQVIKNPNFGMNRKIAALALKMNVSLFGILNRFAEKRGMIVE